MIDLGDEIDHANRVRSIVTVLQWLCIVAAGIGLFGCVIVCAAGSHAPAAVQPDPWAIARPSTASAWGKGVGAGVVLGIAQAAGWAVLWVLLSILRLIAVQTQHALQADLQRQQAALRQRQTPSEFGPRPPPAP